MRYLILTFTMLYLAAVAGCSRRLCSAIGVVAIVSLPFQSCSRQDNGESGINLSRYQAERDRLCQAFDPATVQKCDRSTFVILMRAMCNQPVPTEFEHPEGKWNRDEQASCYPNESRSETSRDAYLSLVLSQDKAAIARGLAWAEKNNGDTGLPSGGVGNVTDLMPIMRRSVRLTEEADGVAEDITEAVQKAFSGHRGHLVAGYLWARARLNGGLTVAGAALLKKIHDETPESPYLSCLYHRFSRLDHDQSGTVRLLKQTGTKTFGWGSAPYELFTVLTVACLEGDK
jgi:hypothetical protein